MDEEKKISIIRESTKAKFSPREIFWKVTSVWQQKFTITTFLQSYFEALIIFMCFIATERSDTNMKRFERCNVCFDTSIETKVIEICFS